MKILTGKYRGRNFYMPADIRPTSNVVRKAIFDILGHDLTNIRFLELFGGSGAVGLEAISLGAEEVLWVERESKCVDVIQGNVEDLLDQEDQDRAQVLQMDVFSYIKRIYEQKSEPFDVVFMDPPFGQKLAKKALNHLLAYDILQPRSWLLVQAHKSEALPEMDGLYTVVKDKLYGLSRLVVMQKN